MMHCCFIGEMPSRAGTGESFASKTNAKIFKKIVHNGEMCELKVPSPTQKKKKKKKNPAVYGD
jgi:hypothetical protein